MTSLIALKMELLDSATACDMTMSEIYRAALEMYCKLGDEAENIASELADKCLVRGDMAGSDGWSRICATISRLRLYANDTVH